jgi:hypothetical protein
VRTKDSCWSMGTIYDPRELPGVSTASPGIGRGVTSGIRADPQGFTGVFELEGSGIWRMAHVGPEWSQGIAYNNTRHTDVTKRGVPRLGLTDEDIDLLRGVDCDILAPRMGYPDLRLNRIDRVFIPTRCIFFFGSLSRKNLQVKRAWIGAIWDG